MTKTPKSGSPTDQIFDDLGPFGTVHEVELRKVESAGHISCPRLDPSDPLSYESQCVFARRYC